jgi:hypothetical protein
MGLSEVVKRAWQDDAFKRPLLTAPRATLEAALGVTLPAGLNIYIHEQAPTDSHLVLPPCRLRIRVRPVRPGELGGG